MIAPDKCPNCGCPVHPQVYTEDGYLVEYLFRCPDCGYGENWSYGSFFDMDDEGEE